MLLALNIFVMGELHLSVFLFKYSPIICTAFHSGKFIATHIQNGVLRTYAKDRSSFQNCQPKTYAYAHVQQLIKLSNYRQHLWRNIRRGLRNLAHTRAIVSLMFIFHFMHTCSEKFTLGELRLVTALHKGISLEIMKTCNMLLLSAYSIYTSHKCICICFSIVLKLEFCVLHNHFLMC